ncbi:glycoside hydrolase family 55 protein [Microthyrium microscopicum]|uniref:Glycoside hydrolase family 55 protein n=1 Tax=Microthyrium microscopicum TaxID=703497 RepID=A0A6A6UJY2_9PEZI|nr:glycoside hydrolase family 55 protein [Microthyrium microscopicum]
MKLSSLLSQIGYFAALSCASVVESESVEQATQSPAASAYWFENVKRTGGTTFRNVKEYGAKGDGVTDDTAAIQKAIAGRGGGGGFFSTTRNLVYFPAGTYVVSSGLKASSWSVFQGDPINRPVIKASAGFSGTVLLRGSVGASSGLADFFRTVKDLVFDTTAVPSSKSLAIILWSLSQGSQIQNVLFKMAPGAGATGHIGIQSVGANSPTFLNDLEFQGGHIGMSISDTQYQFKTMVFKGCTIGIKVNQMLVGTGQNLHFDGVGTGVDSTATGTAHFNLIDSTAKNTKVVFSGAGSAVNTVALQNVKVDATTVRIGGASSLTGSVAAGQTWLKGGKYAAGAAGKSVSPGELIPTPRGANLVDSTGAFVTVVPPTYKEFTVDQVINVKESGARGDGTSDDTAAIQAAVTAAAAKGSLLFFPFGTYIISDTIKVPKNSRLVGEAWTQLRATGAKFGSIGSPRPMIKIGEPGDVGLAQMSTFILDIKSSCPGLKLLEINMAGTKPGDVGFYDIHFPLNQGGVIAKSAGCTSAGNCPSVHVSVHMTPTSSVYWENTWVSDAGGSQSKTANGGGFLVESQGGTWINGLGSEHSAMYQIAIHKAKGVYLGVMQSESAYWQVQTKAAVFNPGSWASALLPGEPNFSWCATGDGSCRVGLYQYVTDSTDVHLYSGGFWNFPCASPTCQTHATVYANNTKLFVWGQGVINSVNMIAEQRGGAVTAAVPRTANVGSNFNGLTPSVLAAYLRQSA